MSKVTFKEHVYYAQSMGEYDNGESIPFSEKAEQVLSPLNGFEDYFNIERLANVKKGLNSPVFIRGKFSNKVAFDKFMKTQGQ